MRKLSEPMIRVLTNLANGRDAYAGCHGMSMHGGMTRVLMALRRRGLIDKDTALTDDGRAAVKSLTKRAGA